LHPALCETTQELLSQRDKRVQPTVTRSTLGSDAQIMGAICLALETAGSRVLSS
jgi:glucokinase